MSHLGEAPTTRTADEVADHLRATRRAHPPTYRRIPPDRLYLDAEDEMRNHHEAMITDAFARAHRTDNHEELEP